MSESVNMCSGVVEEKGEKEKRSLSKTSLKCRGGQNVKLPALDKCTTLMARRADPHKDDSGIGTPSTVRCIPLSINLNLNRMYHICYCLVVDFLSGNRPTTLEAHLYHQGVGIICHSKINN